MPSRTSVVRGSECSKESIRTRRSVWLFGLTKSPVHDRQDIANQNETTASCNPSRFYTCAFIARSPPGGCHRFVWREGFAFSSLLICATLYDEARLPRFSSVDDTVNPRPMTAMRAVYPKSLGGGMAMLISTKCPTQPQPTQPPYKRPVAVHPQI